MTRGGRKKDQDGPERRCIVTGESGPVQGLVRFVLAPDGRAVPDVAGKLPGRGAWVTSDRAVVQQALRKRAFSRAYRRPVDVGADLADLIEELLVKRLVDTISMARRAGEAVTGAEKVRAAILSGAAVLIQARDGAADGKRRLAGVARAVGEGDIAHIEVLDSVEMGLAFGREFAIHAALDAGGFAERVCAEAARLSGFRASGPSDGTIEERNRRGVSGSDPDVEYDNDATASRGAAGEQDDE